MKTIYKKVIPMLMMAIILFLSFSCDAYAMRGKRILASDKYIWVYINDSRYILSDTTGYPCFGQGVDNKNILYMPLNLIANISGYAVSPLKKTTNPDTGEYDIYVTVSNSNESFDVYKDSQDFNGKRLAGKTFILKGTEESGNPIMMVPLGIAKDYFNLNMEVKRPVGRGVYDYCSLAINFKGANMLTDATEAVLEVTGEAAGFHQITDWSTVFKFYKVSLGNKKYHNPGCKYIGKNSASLSYPECVYWGFEPCPDCIDANDDGHVH